MTSSTSRSVSPYAPRCRSSRTIGRIAPRYCTTSRVPTLSTASVRTCSRRVTVSSGIATRRPPPIAASSIRCRSVSAAAAWAAASRDSWRSVVSVRSARRASAWTSRMRATAPSPRTVAPEYSPIALSWPPTALTTISSVLITRSTTSPKRRPSERRTAMTTWPSCRSDGRPSTSVSRTSGSTSPRSRARGGPAQGQRPPREPVDGGAPDLLDRVRGLLGVERDELLQADLRDRVAVAGALDGQRRDDGERQRDPQPADGAIAGFGLDLDRAADGLDVGLDDVHADPAAGYVGDRCGRGETGQEDHLQDVLRAHPVERVGADQAALDGLGADLGRVDARAVVGDLDHDLAALVLRAQGEHALGRLAGPGARLGRLYAVVDGVAHQVGQGVLDRLQERLVELGLAALNLQANGLAALQAEVADDARELGPDVIDRLHARLHDALLQLAGDQVEPLRGADQVGVGRPRDVLDDLVAREHQLADQQHELVEQIDVDADGAVGDTAA